MNEVDELWAAAQRSLDAGEDPLALAQLRAPTPAAAGVREEVARLTDRLALLARAELAPPAPPRPKLGASRPLPTGLVLAAGVAAAALLLFTLSPSSRRGADGDPDQEPPRSEVLASSIVVEHQRPSAPTPTRIDHPNVTTGLRKVVTWTLSGEER